MRGKEFKRLPTSVVPTNYSLTLEPDLEKFWFSGTESVDVVINEETKQIILNSLELQISSASFTTQNNISMICFI